MIKNLNKKRMFLNNVIKVSIMILVIVCLTSCGVLRKIPNDQHSSGGSSSAIKASKNVNVCILFFNDIHGYLQPFTISLFGHDAEVGGIARMATLIDDIRTHNAQQGITTFVFLAGDILQGTPMSTVFKGVPDIECFNEIGVSVMTVGNHEFDFGIENFMRLRKLANFPILSCNIKNDQTGELLCDPSVKLPINDEISLVVIGVTTKELLTTTRPSNVEGISVDDPVDAVLTAYRLNKERFPTIVLSHCKASTDESIAQSIPSLTAIVGGHDQILFNPKKQIGSVPIFQAFEKGRYLGRLDLEINVSTHNVTIADWRYYPITADLTDSETVTGIVNMYHSQLDDVFKEVIGYCGITLHGERDVIRYEETNLGNLVTDIMRDYTGADIALLNAGSLRASISQGPVTVENVFQAMPYANELVVVDITGSELQQILTRSVQGDRLDEDGGFLHVSGLKLRVKGHMPYDITVADKPLDLRRVYKTVITDFMAEGGDGYHYFKGKTTYRTGSPLRELIVDTFRLRHEITSSLDGRIIRESE